MDNINILNVRVDNVTYAEAMEQVDCLSRDPGAHQIATINPEFVVMAQTRLDFLDALNGSALRVPDGVGLLWAARRLGTPLKERVTGQEMVDRISAWSAESGESLPIFFLGAREGVAEQAAGRLKVRYPRLAIAGSFSGSPAIEEESGIIERINASGARILFVAYGPPKQDLWIARNLSRLQVKIAMGVGGTLDILAGRLPRAPRWVREAGFEWTYRLLRQPWRIRRQLKIPYFMWLIMTRHNLRRP